MLQKEFPSLYLVTRHCDSDGPITNLQQWVDEDLSWNIPTNALYDRHALISEPIYGPLVRGSLVPGFDNHTWYLGAWSTLINRKKPTIIICLPPLPEVTKNVKASYQMKGVEAFITAIWYQYSFLAMRLRSDGHKVLMWDYTKDSFEALCEHLMIYLGERYR